ncbi:MAG TPA: hypothetical protein VIY47_17190 [Ignavibacteriaceae bacterium]
MTKKIESKTLKESIALILLELESSEKIANDTSRPENEREKFTQRAEALKFSLKILGNVWDGTREDVIAHILNTYDHTVGHEENGKPRKMDPEEFTDFIENFRDNPYSPYSA